MVVCGRRRVRGEDDPSALLTRGWGRGTVDDVQPEGLSCTAQKRGPRAAQRRGGHNNQTLFEKYQTTQDSTVQRWTVNLALSL